MWQITREEAINHLYYMITKCKRSGERWADMVNVDALEMAYSALKKQEQMEVKTLQLCPACGKDVIGCGDYCWHCGQHLSWEKENESN